MYYLTLLQRRYKLYICKIPVLYSTQYHETLAQATGGVNLG
jgi:hypothetical protein